MLKKKISRRNNIFLNDVDLSKNEEQDNVTMVLLNEATN